MKKLPALIVVLALALTRFAFAADTPAPLAPPPMDAVVIDHGKVEAGFAQGMPLLVNTSYKIQAGRRVTAPGTVEVHAKDTDIFYITDGTATLVTGGTVEGGKPTAENEIRGTKVTGGTIRKLQKGDVVVVPAGVPHWFIEVSNPFLYLIVKVTK